MIRTLAIDDEPVALDVIRRFSADVSFIDLLDTFIDPFKAVERIHQGGIDLLFLDIRMPDMSGIELAGRLKNAPLIIFTTGFSEHAVQGFELDATDYLMKPFSAARFGQACLKAKQRLESFPIPVKEPFIFLRTGQEQIRVELATIRYVQAAGNYVQVFTDTQRILPRLTMHEAEALLPPSRFRRVHRSYIISLAHITRISNRKVCLGDDELPVTTEIDLDELLPPTPTADS